MGTDMWFDFGVALGTCLGSLYIAGNMVMWAWWLRSSDALLRWFFWGVIFIKIGVAQWAGTNAYLVWFQLNDPPVSTLPSRITILLGILVQSSLTIAVFRQRKYNKGRFAGVDRRRPFGCADKMEG